MNHLYRSLLTVIASIALLSACESVPDTKAAGSPTATNTNAVLAKPALEFIDLAGFDRELGASLAAKLPNVNVAVVNTVEAHHIPERIQAWLHAVEDGGGTVTVSPPKSNVTAKNPLILLSVVSGIWNSVKAHKAVKAFELHRPARAYDAEILLKINDQGDRLLDKIIFTERKSS
jgi:hypothetical protein